ncbi:MAG TPA: hypothetical protein VHL78_09395 [Actinomycetota bacterium]|nr:hypothetical protein [Actinomycetota bacterium]
MLQTVATVIGPATLLSALAFYFGWVSTNATFTYFGLDASVLGLTVQEIVLSSTDAVFIPLGAILLIALAAIAAHSAVIRRADRGGDAAVLIERLSTAMIALGGVLLLLGIWAALEPLPFATPFLFQQLSSGIGIALIGYGLYARRRARAATPQRAAETPEQRRLWAAGMALVWMLIALSLFWTMSEYAKALGRGRAQQLALGLGRQPSVVVYAQRDLHLGGPGIVKRALRGEEAAYRFRYSGLTFLVRSGGKYFLVPAGWTTSTGRVVVLPDTEAVRVEFLVARR